MSSQISVVTIGRNEGEWLIRCLQSLQAQFLPGMPTVYVDSGSTNRLAELEWNTPVGEAEACGGDVLMRLAAVREVGGYDPSPICGEEPEMCIRLRHRRWRIWRIDADMTPHDAAMRRFGQWWKRSIRGGWHVAEGYATYGHADERYMRKEHSSGWLWWLLMPIAAISLAALPTRGLSLLLLLSYGVLGSKVYRYRRHQRQDEPATARLYATYYVISKLPQMIGQAKFWLHRLRKKNATLIEYKESAVSPPTT